MRQPRAGLRFVVVVRDGYDPSAFRGLTTWIGTGGKRTQNDLDLPVGYTSRAKSIAVGTVKLPRPAGIDVAVTGASAERMQVGVTRVNAEDVVTTTGEARLSLPTGFLPGHYKVWAMAPGKRTVGVPVTLRSGTVQRVDIALKDAPVSPKPTPTATKKPNPASLGTVTGTVSATAKSTTDVTLLRGGKSYGDGGRVYGAHPKVKITAVKPGTYFLTAVDEVRHRYTTRKVTVRAGRTTSVGTLRPAKKTVTIAGTAPRKAGVNVTGAHGAHFEVASASSSYRIRNIVPGRYTIKVMASDLSSSGWNVIRLSRTYSNVRLVKNRRIALKRGPVSGEIRVKYVSPTAHDAVGTPITTTATRKGRTWTTDSDDTGQKARVPWLDTGSYTLTSKLGAGDPEFEDQHSRDNVWSPYYYVMPSPRTVKVVRGKVTSLGVVPLRITGGL